MKPQYTLIICFAKSHAQEKHRLSKFITCIVFLLACMVVNAQEKDWVDYPYKEISVNCTLQEFPDTGVPLCYFVQTDTEFNNLCSGNKSEVKFTKEIVLGVKAYTTSNRGYRGNELYLQRTVMRDTQTGIIHFMVYYTTYPTPYNRGLIQSWIAIPKPADDYIIHVHFFKDEKADGVEIFRNDKVNYPYRVISVDCDKQKFSPTDSVSCIMIQTRDEFNSLCNEKRSLSTVNFFREIVLGVMVSTEFGGRFPDFRYVMQDMKTGIIHIMVYYDHIPRTNIQARGSFRDQIQRSWVALQKPIGNYEMHLHFVNWNGNKIRVFKNTM